MPQYWLMKSEPDAYAWEDLLKEKRGQGHWEGIRNFIARNYMRNEMQVGDQAFFYYSSCPEPGVFGIMEVASEAYPDHTQFDPKSDYYDEKSRQEKPKWWMVDVKPVRPLPKFVTLKTLRSTTGLEDLQTLRCSRLSITKVTPKEWEIIRKLGGDK